MALVLGGIATAFYLALALVLFYRIGYGVGDAVARTSMARNILYSRDPHLAAIGFVWMPLPTFLQLPAMAILSPLGYQAVVGQVTTALISGFTVFLIVRLLQRWRLSTFEVAALTVLYAINPCTLVTATNGMSEATWYLACVLTLVGYARWADDDDTNGGILLSVGLALAVLCKYEGWALVVVLLALVALQARKRERKSELIFIGVLPIFAMAVWLAVSWLIQGDAFYFYRNSTGQAFDLWWLPSLKSRSYLNSAQYGISISLWFAPILPFAMLGLLTRDIRRSLSERRAHTTGLALLATVGVGGAVMTHEIRIGAGWGNLRYYSSVVVGAVLIGGYLIHVCRGRERVLWRSMVFLLLPLGIASGWLLQLNSPSTVEREDRVLRYVFPVLSGHRDKRLDAVVGTQTVGYVAGPFQESARLVDSFLKPGDQVYVQSTSEFWLTLYSDHPDRFIASTDKDYLQLIDERPPRGRYLFTNGPHRAGAFGQEFADLFAYADDSHTARWIPVVSTPVGILYKLAGG
jgi:hypothetical protein